MTALHTLIVEHTAALVAIETAHERGDRTVIVETMAAARRGLDAIGALVGAPAPGLTLTGADVRSAVAKDGRCPHCGEKAATVPSAGFGGNIRHLCGACGHDAAAA